MDHQLEDIIQEIIRWADAHDAVRAVLLTSTRTVPGAPVDALSDYDVILILDVIRPFVDDRSWLDDFGEVLVAYWDPVYPDPFFGYDVIGNVTQYAGGLKIDFTLWPVELLDQILAAPELPAELDAGYKVLLDKDRRTENMLAPSGKAYIPARPTLENFLTQVNDFLSDAPYVAKYLWRDELLPARWSLECDMIHKYLRQMLEWRVEIDDDWSVSVGNLGKGLKKRLPPEIWREFEGTFASARIEENWEALMRTIALYRKVALQVGESLGYPYPEELHRRVLDYVEHIKDT